MAEKIVDPEFCTTQDIMEAAGVTKLTVRSWVDRGLLPKPTKVSLGYPLGAFLRFPASALMRARFIVARRRAGDTLDEILALLQSEGAEGAAATGAKARLGRRR
ncbi:hypothetical protein OV203_46675 [Nannocystis sp. ILAH1]|uniref:MerR family transcriptional regulator n=1 Tax=Nannocystis sp. ILAH1 TaxID=2996789 RepID=UPI00226D4C98|nr:hypothetical protein [Nannocystis sp. ILAH1]MCY0994700.1 hypothetical protein [Nannocystis sp. ILAH1]